MLYRVLMSRVDEQCMRKSLGRGQLMNFEGSTNNSVMERSRRATYMLYITIQNKVADSNFHQRNVCTKFIIIPCGGARICAAGDFADATH
jgi:hypothetical protein